MKTLLLLSVSVLLSVPAFAVTLVCSGPGGNGPLGGTMSKNPYWLIVTAESGNMSIVGSIVDNKTLKLSKVKAHLVRDLYQLKRDDLSVSLIFPKIALLARDEQTVKGVQVETFWKDADDGEHLKLSLECVARDPKSVNLSP